MCLTLRQRRSTKIQVKRTPPAIHADDNPCALEHASERLAGELRALIGVEYFKTQIRCWNYPLLACHGRLIPAQAYLSQSSSMWLGDARTSSRWHPTTVRYAPVWSASHTPWQMALPSLARSYVCIQLARHRTPAANRSGKRQMCPVIFALRHQRVHRMSIYFQPRKHCVCLI